MIEIITRIIYGLILTGFFVFFPIYMCKGKFIQTTGFFMLGVLALGTMFTFAYVIGGLQWNL